MKGQTVIEVRQARSLIGQPRKQRLTMRGLGLRRIGHQVVLPDTPAIRGMIFKVQHLLEVRVREGQTGGEWK
ncbi:MAG: 50S ribosomal protein L30 [Myxococcota bacterium]